MIATALWTCFACYGTARTQMDTEATAVETPSCCGKPMWLTGTIDRSDNPSFAAGERQQEGK